MPQLKVIISDTVSHQFRRAAMRTHGYAKGSISESAQEAFTEWSKKHDFSREEAKKILGDRDPVDSFIGILKSSKSSVQLQHEVGAILAAKHARTRR